MRPLLDDVEIRTARGRYAVQLEIPPESTLTGEEIERVMALASWDSDPNEHADGYEGGRSVLLKRDRPALRHGRELYGLQVSGIGYQDIRINGVMGDIDPDSLFNPPNRDNFIERVDGTKMGTMYAQGTRFVGVRPSYSPLGTYTTSELQRKVTNTRRVSGLFFNRMATPHVEAYGQYVGTELRDADGPFGFIVVPVPDVETPRVAEAIFTTLRKREDRRGFSLPDSLDDFCTELWPPIISYVRGLRELHDYARIAHLQAHLSNLYLVEGIPYIMDWSTMRRLETDSEGNIRNRVLDMLRPGHNFISVFNQVFSPRVPSHIRAEVPKTMYEISMGAYAGTEEHIDLHDVYRRVHQKLGHGRIDGWTAYIEWMKDLGLEGFPEKSYKKAHVTRDEIEALLADMVRVLQEGMNAGIEHLSLRPPKPVVREGEKIGRNEPCPCGSGRKFKKCCGGH